MAKYRYDKLAKPNRIAVYKDGELVTAIEKIKNPIYNKIYYRIVDNGEVFGGIKEAKAYVEKNF